MPFLKTTSPVAGGKGIKFGNFFLPLEPFCYDLPVTVPTDVWPQIVRTVNANSGKAYEIQCTEFGHVPFKYTTLSDGRILPHNWGSLVLGRNGKIYGMPHNAGSILEIDPVQKTISTRASFLSGEAFWNRGVLASNGKIYGIPLHGTQVLEFDPVSYRVELWGDLPIGDCKWFGGVFAFDKKIYCPPHESNDGRVLVIDIENRTCSFLGDYKSLCSPGFDLFNTPILAPDKKIYAYPGCAEAMLEIDPSNSTSRLISSNMTEYQDSSLAANGSIYGFPFNASPKSDPITKFNPSDASLISTGCTQTPALTTYGHVLAPNGKIYSFRNDSGNLYEFDPSTNTERAIPMGIQGGWTNAIVAQNGNIYAISNGNHDDRWETHETVLEIAFTGGLTPFTLDVCTSNYLNH